MNFNIDLCVSVYDDVILDEDTKTEFYLVTIQTIGKDFSQRVIYIQKVPNVTPARIKEFITKNIMDILKMKNCAKIRIKEN